MSAEETKLEKIDRLCGELGVLISDLQQLADDAPKDPRLRAWVIVGVWEVPELEEHFALVTSTRDVRHQEAISAELTAKLLGIAAADVLDIEYPDIERRQAPGGDS